jgi:hypothetical protein
MVNNRISFFGSFFGIWVHPRKVFRNILDNRPGYRVWPFVLTYAVFSALLPDFYISTLKSVSLGLAVILCIFLSVLFDVACLFYFAGLTFWVGKLMGGKGNLNGLKTAYAWSYPPAMVALPIFLLKAFPVWRLMFSGETNGVVLMAAQGSAWQILLALIGLALTVWAVIIWFFNVSETHQFSIWKSIGTVALVAAPIMLLIMGAVILLVFGNIHAH